MRDVLGQHEGGHQVVDGPGLAAVRPQHERVEAPLPGGRKRVSSGLLRPRLWAGTWGWIPAARRQPSGPCVGPEVGQCWGEARPRAGEGGRGPAEPHLRRWFSVAMLAKV